MFRIVSETGVAAGVRRLEAATGSRAFEMLRDRERTLGQISEVLKATPETALKRAQLLVDERRTLERRLDEALKGGGGGDQVRQLLEGATRIDGYRVAQAIVSVDDAKALQALGDALREQLGSGVAALGATFADGKSTVLVVATDDARDHGLRADVIVREVAAAVGGRGGGKPHMAQAGIPDPARLPDALDQLGRTVRAILAGGASTS